MKNRVAITTAYYFPFNFMIFGGCLLFMGIVLLIEFSYLGLLLILASLTIFTARYRLSINLIKQTYHDYLWIAGFKKGRKHHFNVITGMYINQNAYTQRVNARTTTMTIHGIEYNGYIRFDDQDVHLLSNDNKRKVLRKMKKIQEVLQGDIISSSSIKINSEIADYTKSDT